MNTIRLQSNDGRIFDTPLEVAKQSAMIRTMVDDLGIGADEPDDEPVVLPNVSGTTLGLVLMWCEQHKNDLPPPVQEDDNKPVEKNSNDIDPWDEEFLKVDQGTLYDLTVAANYLDIKGLLDAACKTVANQIKGKTPEELRRHFNIKNDFTPAEEETIRKENAWAEQNE